MNRLNYAIYKTYYSKFIAEMEFMVNFALCSLSTKTLPLPLTVR